MHTHASAHLFTYLRNVLLYIKIEHHPLMSQQNNIPHYIYIGIFAHRIVRLKILQSQYI